jgi:hypothetical protein
MKINIKHKPTNPTKFKTGDVLHYESSPTQFIVVGEDNMYVHTFFINGTGKGHYWGILKATANLGSLQYVE